ncbi:unnamed protein product, partial [Arabidopsis halleri]
FLVTLTCFYYLKISSCSAVQLFYNRPWTNGLSNPARNSHSNSVKSRYMGITMRCGLEVMNPDEINTISNARTFHQGFKLGLYL